MLTLLVGATTTASAGVVLVKNNKSILDLNRINIGNYLNEEKILSSISKLTYDDINTKESNGLTSNLELSFKSIISRLMNFKTFNSKFFYGKIDENSSFETKSENFITFDSQSPNNAIYFFTIEVSIPKNIVSDFYGTTYITIDLRPDFSGLEKIYINSKNKPTSNSDFLNKLKLFTKNKITIKKFREQYTNFEISDDFIDLDFSSIDKFKIDSEYDVLKTDALDSLSNKQKARLFKIGEDKQIEFIEGLILGEDNKLDASNWPNEVNGKLEDYWPINTKENRAKLDDKLIDWLEPLKNTVLDKIKKTYNAESLAIEDINKLKFGILVSNKAVDLETVTIGELSKHISDREKDKKWAIISITDSESYKLQIKEGVESVKMHFDVFFED
ncbi:hypothetical protein SCHIN_v1c03570 [Spiroplasma chinense]|uniref:Uncharacterized protein n=2 Tax=Spiroplasma chinense TaxID=216932 RepID=A0A5B9Y3E1_9MOLU|nr:hypothetical protein SCHIN_v1c03570 [Spiroplasma chinense]